jgi:hypothetical protein
MSKSFRVGHCDFDSENSEDPELSIRNLPRPSRKEERVSNVARFVSRIGQCAHTHSVQTSFTFGELFDFSKQYR